MASRCQNSFDSSSRGSKNLSVSLIDQTEDAIFTAGLDDVTTMSKILQELHHADDHSVLVITQSGIRLITAGEKTFQVSAYFASSTFQRFNFDHENHDQITFRFMLRDFIESLNLLRDDPIIDSDKAAPDDCQQGDLMRTSLYIQYRRKGEPLRLRLENKSNYVINCDLKAFSLPNGSIYFPLGFPEDDETAVILLNSKRFYDYVSGLDFVSSEFVHLIMGRGDVPIRLSTKSTQLGEAELEITRNETEIIRREIVVSDNCLFSFSYKTQSIRPALEALKSSALTQMKCGSSGLLCIEHFHPTDKRGGTQFVAPDGPYNCSQNSMDFISQYNHPQNKRSSVEYFILSEAKPIDACPD